MKCVVKGCTNHSHEGVFVGLICGPCYEMITTGKYNPSKAWFIQDIDLLKAELGKKTEEIEACLGEVYRWRVLYDNASMERKVAIDDVEDLRTQFADCRVRHEMQRIENDKLLDELNTYRLNKENTANVFLEAENSKLQDDICILERNVVNLASDKAFLARCLKLAHETIDQYRSKLGDVYK